MNLEPDDRILDTLLALTAQGYTTKYFRLTQAEADKDEPFTIRLSATGTLIGTPIGFEAPAVLRIASLERHFGSHRWEHSGALSSGERVQIAVPVGEPLLVMVKDATAQVGICEVGALAPGGVVDFGALRAVAGATLQCTSDSSHQAFRVVVRHGDLFIEDLASWIPGEPTAIDGLLPGRAEVWLQLGGSKGLVERTELEVGRVSAVHLSQGARIEGRVLDETGAAAAEVIVVLGPSPLRATRTDAKGRFEFGGLHSDMLFSVQPQFEREGVRPEPPIVRDIRPNGSPLEFRLRDPVFSIRGEIAPDLLARYDGKPLFVAIVVAGKQGALVRASGGRFVVPTDGAGPFRLTLHVDVSGGFPPAILEVDIAPLDRVFANSGSVLIEAGRD